MDGTRPTGGRSPRSRSPALYEHVRVTDIDGPDGIYRVVGRTAETVTLLRVGDADERRVHTGELVAVAYGEYDGFEPAANPDGNRSLRAAMADAPEFAYWSLRAFVQQLAANPRPATAAATLVLAGTVGERLLPLPALVAGGFLVVGCLGLAYVGGGRLQRRRIA